MIKFGKNFDYIKIKLASPFRILQWANRKLPNGQFVGEVTKSETINYRTFKPEMDGLFCERIFGPNKSLECSCGKYKRVRYEGLICEKCGVEITESSVRRHRMGYINLIYPVTHVWYINSRPNFLALLLEVEEAEKNLDNPGTGLTAEFVELWDERIKRIKLASLAYFIAEDEISFYGLHWDLQQYRMNRGLGKSRYQLKPYPKPKPKYRNNTPKYLLQATPNFLIGTPVIKQELERLNLNDEIAKMRYFLLFLTKAFSKEKFDGFTGQIQFNFNYLLKWERQRLYKIRDKCIKRIRILENLVGSGSKPAWIILTILPVIPPALRPMIQLEGGRFATSDLNELYRRIITRNNRLVRFLEMDAPQLIIRNEKRLLQEAVDTLIDNGKRGKVALSTNNRPFKSLSDIIKGKYGRFRQNLLGKRVDYSGRSVIVVGPTLKLNQCGLPYEIITELFQPFIIRELLNQGLASTMKMAKNLIQQNKSILEPVLEKILKNHPIFLNRAPTLHRLGVQAFEPILVKGKAIKLHPLVCSAFNADFDGDQMAVHVPLSIEAQAECYMLMLAPYNFLSPANSEPIIIPSQDMVLGCYYLTVNNINSLLGSKHYFANLNDVIFAYNQNQLEIHSEIWLRIPIASVDSDDSEENRLIKKIDLKDGTVVEYYKNQQIRKNLKDEVIVTYILTTTGRALLNYIIQKTLNFL